MVQKNEKGKNKGEILGVHLPQIANGQKNKTHKTFHYTARKLIAIATWKQAAGMCKMVYCSIIVIIKGEIQSPEQTSFRGNMISGKILLQKEVEITTIL